MLLKSAYKILPDFNLIIEYHKGILTIENYIEFKQKLAQDSLFKANMSNFVHFKNVTFNVSSKDIENFVLFMETKKESLGKRRIALLTNTPSQVVQTTIYKSLESSLKQDVEIFSINEVAINWLLQKNFNEDIESILSELSKSI